MINGNSSVNRKETDLILISWEVLPTMINSEAFACEGLTNKHTTNEARCACIEGRDVMTKGLHLRMDPWHEEIPACLAKTARSLKTPLETYSWDYIMENCHLVMNTF